MPDVTVEDLSRFGDEVSYEDYESFEELDPAEEGQAGDGEHGSEPHTDDR